MRVPEDDIPHKSIAYAHAFWWQIRYLKYPFLPVG